MLKFRWGVGVLLALGLEQTQAQWPGVDVSFDCSLASMPTETAICKSIKLAYWDQDLNRAYNAFRQHEYFDEDDLAAQRRWIGRRDACGQNSECIENAYIDRIREIQTLMTWNRGVERISHLTIPTDLVPHRQNPAAYAYVVEDLDGSLELFYHEYAFELTAYLDPEIAYSLKDEDAYTISVLNEAAAEAVARDGRSSPQFQSYGDRPVLAENPVQNYFLQVLTHAGYELEGCSYRCSVGLYITNSAKTEDLVSISVGYSQFWQTAHPWSYSFFRVFEMSGLEQGPPLALTFFDLIQDQYLSNVRDLVVRSLILEAAERNLTQQLDTEVSFEALGQKFDELLSDQNESLPTSLRPFDADRNGQIDTFVGGEIFFYAYVDSYKFDNLGIDASPFLDYLKPEYRDSFE